jgi:hypothetical protein
MHQKLSVRPLLKMYKLAQTLLNFPNVAAADHAARSLATQTQPKSALNVVAKSFVLPVTIVPLVLKLRQGEEE